MATKRRKRTVKRTKKGTVTAAARRQYGQKGTGRFPIFDRRSARSALGLRGRAKTKTERAGIIRRAAKYMPGSAKLARQRDRQAGKI